MLLLLLLLLIYTYSCLLTRPTEGLETWNDALLAWIGRRC
jgi:hypothetical protein